MTDLQLTESEYNALVRRVTKRITGRALQIIGEGLLNGNPATPEDSFSADPDQLTEWTRKAIENPDEAGWTLDKDAGKARAKVTVLDTVRKMRGRMFAIDPAEARRQKRQEETLEPLQEAINKTIETVSQEGERKRRSLLEVLGRQVETSK